MRPAPVDPADLNRPGQEAAHETGVPRTTSRLLALAGLVLAGVLIALPLWKVAAQHLASPNVWFDESGQYWLALGLHHFSEPGAEPGGWAKIVEYGRIFNSDPGAFTLLLRGWIGVFGSGPAALRSLPFAFLVLACVLIALAVRRTGASWPLAVVAAAAPLGFPMLLHYATELRAYSMEVCAVSFLFFASAWTDGRWDPKRALVLGLAAAVLVASRYSAWFYAAAACAVALLPLKPWPLALRRTLAFAGPVTLSVLLGYVVFARLQAGGSHEPPAYVVDFLLKDKSGEQALALLRTNFLGREALPLTVFLVAAPLFVFLGPRSLADFRVFVGRAWLFAFLSVALVGAASLVGKLPWALHTRWSIGYQALSACCLALGIVVIVRWFSAFPFKRLAAAVQAVLLTVAAWGLFQESARATERTRPYYETIADHFATLAAERDPRSLRLFVPSNASPTVRYLCERGPFRNVFTYPEHFHFETPEELAAVAPIPATRFDVVVLTHHTLADGYIARVTEGSAMLQGAPQPSCLLLLSP